MRTGGFENKEDFSRGGYLKPGKRDLIGGLTKILGIGGGTANVTVTTLSILKEKEKDPLKSVTKGTEIFSIRGSRDSAGS